MISDIIFRIDTETNATRYYEIVDYTIHSAYDGNNNDIAICTINGIIQPNTEVGPVCLPFQHQLDSFNGEIVTVLGRYILLNIFIFYIFIFYDHTRFSNPT